MNRGTDIATEVMLLFFLLAAMARMLVAVIEATPTDFKLQMEQLFSLKSTLTDK